MYLSFLKNSSPGTKILFSVVIIFISAVFFSMLGMIIALPLFNISFSELMNIIANYQKENIHILKYFQIIQSTSIFVIPAIILAFFFSDHWTNYLKLNRKAGYFSILLVILIMISIIPVINLLAELNSLIDFPDFLAGIEKWMKEKEELAEKITKMFLMSDSFGVFLLNFTMIAIIPAIGEELCFRGIFQRLFTEMTNNIHLGIIISSLFFSAVHLQFYGFIPRFLLGSLFGYMLVWSRTMWLPIIAHFVNNGVAVIFYYFVSRNKIDSEMEEIGAQQGTYMLAIVSLIIGGILIYYLYNYLDKLKTNKF